jgi:hypothetical protein
MATWTKNGVHVKHCLENPLNQRPVGKPRGAVLLVGWHELRRGEAFELGVVVGESKRGAT